MKIALQAIVSIVLLVDSAAFAPSHHRLSRVPAVSTRLRDAEAQTESAPAAASVPEVKEIGLLTFDLDDTLYPIDQVIKAANGESSVDKRAH
jgi:hypothetical protein